MTGVIFRTSVKEEFGPAAQIYMEERDTRNKDGPIKPSESGAAAAEFRQ